MVWLEHYTDRRALMLFPFLDSPFIPLAYLSTYIIAILYGQIYMKSRAPYDLKRVLAAYNVLQVFLCVYIISCALNGGFNHEYIWKCIEIDSSRDESAMYMVYGSYYTWLLKGFELLETIFFVLRKKDSQVSLLHVYHHISTFTLTWFFARSVAGGMLVFSVVLNSTVHILMYSYYFVSLFGTHIQQRLGWFKIFITRFQIVQFLILLVNGAIAFNPSCNSPKTFLSFYMLNLTFLLYMFVRFYIFSYLKKKSTKSS